MGKSRFEKKKEETRQKIINVAMNLFYKQGFDSTTLEQIAEEADIARKTLYNHFSVKEAIIGEYVQRELIHHTPTVMKLMHELPDTRSRLLTLFRISQEWVDSKLNSELNKKFFLYQMQIIDRTENEKNQRTGLNSALTYIIRLGQEKGEIRKDMPTEILVHQLEAIHVFTIAAWLAVPEKYSVYERIPWNVDIFLNGAIDKRS